jgi:hypothetical protein
LERHATVFGELFNRHDIDMMESLEDRGVLIRIGQDPIEFLKWNVFVHENESEYPTGFCLPSHQARCAAWSRVWGYIRTHTRIVQVFRSPLESLKPIFGTTFVDPHHIKTLIHRHEASQRDLQEYFYGSQILLVNPINPEPLKTFLKIDIHHEPYDNNPQEWVENYDELRTIFKDTPYRKYMP